jgi:glutamyl/glutaminyl-tRNA synthetase
VAYILEDRNEYSGCVRGEEFIYQRSNYQLLKKNFAHEAEKYVTFQYLMKIKETGNGLSKIFCMLINVNQQIFETWRLEFAW